VELAFGQFIGTRPSTPTPATTTAPMSKQKRSKQR